jgi:tetratricopeptide (TPR) repeat protein
MFNLTFFLVIFLAMQGPLPLPMDVELLGEALEWFRQGEAMIGTDSEYTEAQARCFREAVALSPEFEQARHNLILVLLAQEKFQEAEDQSFQLINRKPDFIQAYLLRAEARLKAGKFEDAQDDLSLFLNRYPDDSRGLELQGRIYFSQGEYSKATAAYKRAGKISNDNLIGRISTGLSLLNSGMRKEASEVFAELVIAFPKSWVSHFWLGASLRDLGRLDEALFALQKAEGLDPDNERVRKELVETFLELGDLKNAGRLINRKKDKTVVDYTNLALLARAEDNPDNVLTYLQKAAELTPDDTAILVDLGGAQVEAKRTGEAAVTYRRILEIDQADFTTHLSLAFLLLDRGDLEDSRELLERAVSLEPDSAEAHLRLAQVMDKMGFFERAREGYERSLELGSQNLAVYFRLGFLLAEKGDGEGALLHLSKAVSGDPRKYIPLLIKELENVNSALESIRHTAPFSELVKMYKEYGVEGDKK